MQNRVLTIKDKIVDEGTSPDVKGVGMVSHETPALYTLHGDLAPGINTKWTRPCVGVMHELAPEQYLVIADDAVVAANDKLALGKSPAQLGSDYPYWKIEGTALDGEGNSVAVSQVKRFGAGKVPAGVASKTAPWSIDGATITKAVPGIPCKCAGLDLDTKSVGKLDVKER